MYINRGIPSFPLPCYETLEGGEKEEKILTVPKAMSLLPAGIRIFARYPVVGVSMSMVALSVSISAMMSPSSSTSPSAFSHWTIVPCSMVGDRAGSFTKECSGRSDDRWKHLKICHLNKACINSLAVVAKACILQLT